MRLRWMTLVVLLVATAQVSTAACGPALTGELQDGRLPRDAIVNRIVIHKSAHRLQLYDGKRLLKTYRIAIGGGTDGPKQSEGDKRTPEGTYHITGRHRSKKFRRFLSISYPNQRDRRRYKRLQKMGAISKTVGIGGLIGIHGEKRGFSWLPHKLKDWTLGCIAVNNDEIDELYRVVAKRAVVIIKP